MTGHVQHNGTVPAGDAALALVRDVLASLSQDVDSARRIDRIRLLEEIKSQAAAAQARETAAFVTEQRETQAAAGVRAEGSGAGSPPRSGWRVGSRRSTRAATWAGR